MKQNLKSAFTLAEALSALAIIGVIAAISLPQLGVNVQKNSNAATLGRVVQIMSNGCQSLITDVNSNFAENPSAGVSYHLGHSDITRAEAFPSATQDLTDTMTGANLLRYSAFGFREDNIPENYSRHEYNGSESDVFNGNSIFAGDKLNAYVVSVSVPENDREETDNPITDLILIDANGAERPNRYGKDIFMFGLTDKCSMIPAGTQRMASVATKLNNATFNSDQATGCGNNITSGLTCTSRVVKDKYRIKYY